jgi:hypothetical protein
MSEIIVVIQYFNKRQTILLEAVKCAVEESLNLEIGVLKGYLVTEFINGFPVRASSYCIRKGNVEPDWQGEIPCLPCQQCWQGMRRASTEEKI